MNRFMKGYKNDAGIDVILDKDVLIKANSHMTVCLGINVTPKRNQMAIIVPRSSAALKGIHIATCPIDPEYTGIVHAMIFNCSNNDIEYKKEESFCQVIFIKCGKPTINFGIKKKGKRGYGKFGSTK